MKIIRVYDSILIPNMIGLEFNPEHNRGFDEQSNDIALGVSLKEAGANPEIWLILPGPNQEDKEIRVELEECYPLSDGGLDIGISLHALAGMLGDSAPANAIEAALESMLASVARLDIRYRQENSLIEFKLAIGHWSSFATLPLRTFANPSGGVFIPTS